MTDTTQNNEKKPLRQKYIITGGLFVLLIMSVLIFIIFSQNQKPDPESEKIIREIATEEIFSLTKIKKDVTVHTKLGYL